MSAYPSHDQFELSLIVFQPEKAIQNLAYLGLTQAFVARQTGHTPREVSDWVHERSPAPKAVLAWLGMYASNERAAAQIEYLQRRLRADLDHAKARGINLIEDPDYDRENLRKRSRRGQRVLRRKTVTTRRRAAAEPRETAASQ